MKLISEIHNTIIAGAQRLDAIIAAINAGVLDPHLRVGIYKYPPAQPMPFFDLVRMPFGQDRLIEQVAYLI